MNGRIFRMDIPAHQAVQELLPWFAAGQLEPEQMAQMQEHLHSCLQCQKDLEWERTMRAAASPLALPEGLDMERALERLRPALGAQEPAAAGMDASAEVGTPRQPQATGQTPHQLASQSLAQAASQSPATPSQEFGADVVKQIAPETPQTLAVQQHRPAANQPSWLRWTVAAQWAVIAGLGALLAYPALKDGTNPPASYRVLGAGSVGTGNLVVVFQPDTSERELRRILQAQGARVVDGPTVTDAYLINVPSATRPQALQALRAEAAVKLAEALDTGG